MGDEKQPLPEDRSSDGTDGGNPQDGGGTGSTLPPADPLGFPTSLPYDGPVLIRDPSPYENNPPPEPADPDNPFGRPEFIQDLLHHPENL